MTNDTPPTIRNAGECIDRAVAAVGARVSQLAAEGWQQTSQVVAAASALDHLARAHHALEFLDRASPPEVYRELP